MRSASIGSGFGILGMGGYLPSEVVDNEEIARGANTTVEWIEERTGVHSRRRARSGERVADMAAAACRAAMADTVGRTGGRAHPELLVTACSNPDRRLPAHAFDVHSRLELGHIPALNLDAACAGFAQGMVTAHAYYRAGMASEALIVGSHRVEGSVDMTDRRVAPLFGDGAGAFVMGPVPEGYGILGELLLTESTYVEALHAPYPGTVPLGEDLMDMDGHTLTQVFATFLPQMMNKVLGELSMTLQDVEHFILHQANVRMLASMGDALGVDPRRISTVGRRIGNTTSASLPLTSVKAEEEIGFQRGDLILFATGGAGVNGAVIVLRWY
ncbi:Beta-ketoacyl-acyl-carrier-protein synthase I OS=Tsukamurella paurometabola (strain ATCC 8368 / DSM / CCUG 35730 / CIP 100753 / JCM 10117 / KCTC 9821 /NBRC 16120 / NCIMB 702349 / NCTC 13040) OX=521096 GN=Tpau_2231 PE=4 SV=1 [Tsukamurella paurometabola]|uniref:Beta-ketoacyl-acyl-carrier-protein synthase I n=1 Tax=Tsukamurella paurometabola (strain ATCC 8368 / DSM 20162 / CCUG 35730 / CIP 100753 / JCM 10117 / KCTC 9821 / NBRC 16120 / NCIMB 702349 / NCTC 13040) TaxID=521096 RepID=D5UQ70_TSUPD|nr:ketoacyl-ACP synthase III [Tsukamurella paurometabola]ADG78840.1 Beta-ketoacyl-acyl-carrier-protein synthase I [Tsukamurella paurometabola DSM 20162]SUP33295.1 3-oxoacyl-[acyl-carrier-protein] synthase 3 [Tsukamurella paurometabola]